jgi:hypothetical protein
MATGTIEWAPFKLAEGADEASLLRAADAIQDGFLAKQPGFVRRELLKGEDGQWADLVYWESADAAAAAMKEAAASPACFEYFRLMVGANQADPGVDLQHFERKKTYAGE